MTTGDPLTDVDWRHFDALQARLVDLWPHITMRMTDPGARTIVVVSSLSIRLPAAIEPLLAAYEERYLFYVLLLAKAPGTRVVYVTSQPVPGRLIDHYFDLVGLPESARADLVMLSLGDPSPRPLTVKILERPRTLQRIRGLLVDEKKSLLVPFVTTELEARLALALGIPVYGAHPSTWRFGTKSGSRQVFAESGVAHPRGEDGVRGVDDLVDALAGLMAEPDSAQRFMVKQDDGISGLGNALVDTGPARESSTTARPDRRRIEACVHDMALENDELGSEQFLAELANAGGIVEERLEGKDVTSPSAQARLSPLGETEVLSTHDQVLGGPQGMTYRGCRFPAAPAYAQRLVAPTEAIAKTLSDAGVLGRFGVDFLVRPHEAPDRQVMALEINLRNGGTTHPLLTLQALTDGTYDAQSGLLQSRYGPRFYVATDHLEGPDFGLLTVDDVTDLVEDGPFAWDRGTGTGAALHMTSAIGVAGCLGLTAIGGSPEHAQEIYDGLADLVTGAAAAG
jgi:hypothetical protein